AWWAAVSPAPVVGIGGVMAPEQLAQLAASGASAGCVVRGLAAGSAHAPHAWLQAWQAGLAQRAQPAPGWPQPSLPGGVSP
ncbi:hypothetical protein DBR42_08800, partial [Pelomonas sp. HMWF004]